MRGKVGRVVKQMPSPLPPPSPKGKLPPPTLPKPPAKKK